MRVSTPWRASAADGIGGGALVRRSAQLAERKETGMTATVRRRTAGQSTRQQSFGTGKSGARSRYQNHWKDTVSLVAPAFGAQMIRTPS